MSAARRSLVLGPASRSRNSVSSSLAAAMFLCRLACWRRVSKVLHTQTTVRPSAEGNGARKTKPAVARSIDIAGMGTIPDAGPLGGVGLYPFAKLFILRASAWQHGDEAPA